jgi:hypothetical protein
MKEIDKKQAPQVSGGGELPYVTDPPCLPDPDYPKEPGGPLVDYTKSIGELDLPSTRA